MCPAACRLSAYIQNGDSITPKGRKNQQFFARVKKKSCRWPGCIKHKQICTKQRICILYICDIGISWWQEEWGVKGLKRTIRKVIMTRERERERNTHLVEEMTDRFVSKTSIEVASSVPAEDTLLLRKLMPTHVSIFTTPACWLGFGLKQWGSSSNWGLICFEFTDRLNSPFGWQRTVIEHWPWNPPASVLNS